MVNTDDFIKRLEILLEYYTLNASSFADKIGVQRSSMSHLLSGRNKPSLDFVMKIMEVFPDVNVYWILDGKGSFLKSNLENEKTEPVKIENSIDPIVPKNEVLQSLFDSEVKPSENIIPEKQQANFIIQDDKKGNGIYKIVIFYNDGTFKDFDLNSFSL